MTVPDCREAIGDCGVSAAPASYKGMNAIKIDINNTPANPSAVARLFNGLHLHREFLMSFCVKCACWSELRNQQPHILNVGFDLRRMG
jgi:hypothetical protein